MILASPSNTKLHCGLPDEFIDFGLKVLRIESLFPISIKSDDFLKSAFDITNMKV